LTSSIIPNHVVKVIYKWGFNGLFVSSPWKPQNLKTEGFLMEGGGGGVPRLPPGARRLIRASLMGNASALHI